MIGGLLGGIGLFLLGMHLMTEGLKFAAGQALKRILERWTRTPLRGILSGALITSVVQSSSAVTVAIIGFVNAGLMGLAQAVGVIYGSNIGTTVTGWLVAIVGFDINIKALALPLVGLGMVLRIIYGGKRYGALGEAMAGFGVFFMGIDVLKAAFEGLGQIIHPETLVSPGLTGLIFFVGVGFVLTVLMQSSSAAMAVTLTAASGGVIPLNAGAALVIGANLGTTSTAALAVIGATPNAKRVAGAHVAFNLITGAAALLILPLFLSALVALRRGVGLGDDPAPLLALFHTAFNVVGIFLMWPLTRWLVRFLEKRFRSAEEEESRPRYLDRNVMATSALAMEALVLEIGRIGAIARRMAVRAISGSPSALERMEADRRALDSLVEAAGEYSGLIRQSNMPAELSALLPNALRISRYYSETAELALEVARARGSGNRIHAPELASVISHFEENLLHLVECADAHSDNYTARACKLQLQELQEEYQILKSRLLRAGSEGEVAVKQLVDELDLLSNIKRIGEQIEKGARYLADLRVPMTLV
jgi:phosphate:Na+ symporter